MLDEPCKVESNIIDATRRLIALNGISKVSMSLLSKNLDLSKSSIYYYFSSKDQIFESLVQEQVNEFHLVKINIDNKIDANIALNEIIDYLLEGDMFLGVHMRVLLSILQDCSSGAKLSDKIDQLFSDIQQSMKQSIIKKNDYPESLANEISKDVFSMICGAIVLTHANDNYEQLSSLHTKVDNYIFTFQS